jgi:predicted HTH transcriptional regulator
MNADGGTLFIGVADNADITGIEVEVGKTKLHKSLDKYLNTIKNVFKSKIGSASLTNCNFRSVKIRGKKILKVDCKKSNHQVYVDNRDTYVRMGPSTNKLEGPDLVTFSKERFS